MSSAASFNCSTQPWGIRGTIVHGHGRGGTMLGFPTANIDVTADHVAVEATLKEGINHVFFGWGVVEKCGDASVTISAEEKEKVFPVVMSVGYNPHFKDVHTLAIEAHYLHKFSGDFYGSVVRVAILGDLRVMGAFTTLEALIAVIQKDCDDATEKLASLEAWKSCSFLTAKAAEGDNKLPTLVTPLTL